MFLRSSTKTPSWEIKNHTNSTSHSSSMLDTKPLSKLPDSISVFPFSALDLSSLIAFLTVLWFVDLAILKGKGRVRRSPTRGSSSTGKTVFPWMVNFFILIFGFLLLWLLNWRECFVWKWPSLFSIHRKKWMVVIMLSIILPSYRHKWGPLVFLRSKHKGQVAKYGCK